MHPLVNGSPGAGGETLIAHLADKLLAVAGMDHVLVLLLLDPSVEPFVAKAALEAVELGVHVDVEVGEVLVRLVTGVQSVVEGFFTETTHFLARSKDLGVVCKLHRAQQA